MLTYSILNQTLYLYPQRAMYWVEEKTAIVADPHFGKAATFRAAGVPLPAGTTSDNLARLSTVLTETHAERLVILGDLLHAKAGQSPEVHKQVQVWRNRFDTLTIDVVLGNHDRHAGRPPDAWRMTCVERLIETPFVWQHFPAASTDGYVVGGHVHPAVNLRGEGERLTLPCFYFGERFGILPAFGDFTGFGTVRPRRGDAVFVLADGEVVAVGR